MRYLLLPVLLTVLCLTAFTSQVQAQAPALMSLEHGGTTDVMGSREFTVPVCNEFEVELWVRDLPSAMVALLVYITWDPDLMELQNVGLTLPAGWGVNQGPTEQADSWVIRVQGDLFSLNWKWMTFTFHCKGEGSSPINIPEFYDYPSGGSGAVGPIGPLSIDRTLLKAAVTQTPEPPPVGGIVTPTNKLAILTPYIALAGLIIAVSTVYIIKRRKD
ncbi:hypothetical protein ACFLQ6_07940 [Thermoproteota archaeon]